jgi:hypothetical protein
MKKILGLCLVGLVMSCSGTADIREKMTFLSAVAGNANAAALTFTVPLANSSYTVTSASQMANLFFNLDYTSGATAVGMICSVSDDSGSTLFLVQSCAVLSGACTSSDASWSKAIAAADKKWAWRVDFTGYTYGSCAVTITGGAANDALTVTGWMSSK